MIETRRLKNVVIVIQTIVNFVLSREIFVHYGQKCIYEGEAGDYVEQNIWSNIKKNQTRLDRIIKF